MERHGGMPLANFPVDWEVASDSGFRDVVSKGTHLSRPELAHRVPVEVAVLQPYRPYYYLFTACAERRLRGRARTLRSLEPPTALQSLMRSSSALLFFTQTTHIY